MSTTRRSSTHPIAKDRHPLRSAPVPYVIVSRRARVAHDAKRALRVARVHHGRATSRSAHILALLEHGKEPTRFDLETLAQDLRFVDIAMDNAATVVQQIIDVEAERALTVTLPADREETSAEARTVEMFPSARKVGT